MSGVNGRPGAGVGPPPEQVRAHTEEALKQVMAAAEVAQGMWRLLLAEGSRHRTAGAEPGNRRDAELPEPAARLPAGQAGQAAPGR